mmetsp:Transcript_57180/g.127651  ORF Transcript_57180/g.127651 Transcript_57180/m.127651 type:complete len:230 (+) Transcript_57180:642-1331(+)
MYTSPLQVSAAVKLRPHPTSRTSWMGSFDRRGDRNDLARGRAGRSSVLTRQGIRCPTRTPCPNWSSSAQPQVYTCPVRVQTAEWLPPPATDHQSCAWPVFSERRSDPISPPIEMRLSSRPPPPSRSDLPPSRRRGRTRCSVHSVGEVRVRSSPLPKRPLPPSPQLNRRVDPRLELCTTAREWYAPAATDETLNSLAVKASRGRGRSSSRSVPWPSWPQHPLPHVKTSPA